MRVGNERDDKSSIRGLRDQMAKMKRRLKGKRNEESTSNASSTTSDQREVARGDHHRRAPFQDGRTSDQVLRGETSSLRDRVSQASPSSPPFFPSRRLLSPSHPCRESRSPSWRNRSSPRRRLTWRLDRPQRSTNRYNDGCKLCV
jgi:hypothetical protein